MPLAKGPNLFVYMSLLLAVGLYLSVPSLPPPLRSYSQIFFREVVEEVTCTCLIFLCLVEGILF